MNMFTGIVEAIGTINQVSPRGRGLQITICTPSLTSELTVNDSIAVNGVCQTVITVEGPLFTVEAVEETLKKTTFSQLAPAQKVNLEMPMRLGDRLGGHLVLGHVDCTGVIAGIETRTNSHMVTISFPSQFRKYLIPTGSITVDGVSLTVAELEPDLFRVSIIPHTMVNTIFQFCHSGDNVNLEFDVIGKHIEQLAVMAERPGNLPFAEKQLREMGF